MIINKGDLQIEYVVVEKTIKHAYFHFKGKTLVVSKNKRISMASIEAYILTHFDKFYKKLNQKIMIPTYFGKELTINFLQSSDFTYVVHDEITIYHKEHEKEASLKLFYQQELMRKVDSLKGWLTETLKPVGLSPLPTKVKWLKSKYGSCHIRKHEITLNAFLAKLDVIYLKYVLLHEYAHIIVPNHQKPFYDVLDKLMPEHKSIQKALKKHHL